VRSAVFVFFIAFLIVLAAPASALDGWSYYRPITITNSLSQSLTDYQVNFTLNTANLIVQGKMRSDCGDLRVTLSDGQTLLPYWIEPNTCNTSATRIWIKIPSIPASGSVTIYVWYGNLSAASAADGSAVFVFFDDASSNKSSAYVFRNLYNAGQPGSLSYDATNKRYTISWSPADNIALTVNGLILSNAEIEVNFITPSSISTNYQFGAIIRYSTSGVYFLRTLNTYSPDRIEFCKEPTPPNTALTTLIYTSLGGDLITTNANYRIIARAYGSNLYAWISINNVTLTASDSNYTSGEWGIFTAYDISSIYFNFVKIRQYVSPEPSVSVGNELIAKPDLTVISADYSPKPASVQQQISISAQIANTGNCASPIANVTLYIDGNAIQTAQVSGLNPNETTTVTFAWIPNAIGTYTATIVVDPDNVIGEINENNNSYNLTIEVSRIADLTVNVTLPKSGTVGREVTFSVVVMNIGSAAAYNFSIAVYIDTNKIDEKRIDFLDQGGQILFNYSFIPHEARTYTITAIVDPENSVIESAENNNAANATIEIIASSSITITPSDIVKIPTPPKPEGRTLKEVYESTTLKVFGLPLEVLSLIALLSVAVVGYGFGAFRGTVNLFFLSVLYYMAANALGWSTYIATGLLVVSAILLVIVVAFMRED
jgi:hypothetical protein